MKPDPAVVSKALKDLFRTYPSFQSDDPTETMRVYFTAISEYETQDVLAGIRDFITGSVPGHNPAFAPSAPQVGSAARRAMERRLDAARLDKLALPPPADDFQDDPPEVKAKNKARLDALVAHLAQQSRTDEAKDEKARRDLQNRSNARFAPSFEPADMAKRLGVGVSYSVGDDPAAEDMDMGQMRGRA